MIGREFRERGCILWAFFWGPRVVLLGLGAVQTFLFGNPLSGKREAERDWKSIHIKPHILQVMPESRSCMIMSYHQISTSPTFFRHQFVSRHFFLHGSSGYVVAGEGFLVLCHSTAFGRSLASGCLWFMVDDSCHLHGDLRRLGLFPVWEVGPGWCFQTAGELFPMVEGIRSFSINCINLYMSLLCTNGCSSSFVFGRLNGRLQLPFNLPL